ncbi:MAG: DUF3086 domain-containing protein [Geminocystis sp.]|nr:DUF3086 domain-containing protein [Geminocystis sp.]MCS7148586.1 DUF3086 domain-containing protein [Geminocystis sp.]MCX8078151.1 DUF3086 domain-containing protein [Geminocystis sp.]MDW8115022.1 DUF3086 domain-containing protein [Geminocystis sp.]
MSNFQASGKEKNNTMNFENFEDDDDIWEKQNQEGDGSRFNIETNPTGEDSPHQASQETSLSQENLLPQQENPDVDTNTIATETPQQKNTASENIPLTEKSASFQEKKWEDIQLDKESILAEINDLISRKNELIRQQEEISKAIGKIVENGLAELENKRRNLEIAIEKLERRKEKIEQEIKRNFLGISQELAIRLQGFKDYLIGSLQELVAAAEEINLSPPSPTPVEVKPTSPTATVTPATPQFVEKAFREETRQIRRLLDQYRTKPDYYGPPWQLRRTFEPLQAERVATWFFSLGGRGAVPSLSTRLQNILVASAIISILYHLYGDRVRVLLLADTPEKLGEWRRGLQDCLGISRSDFGPNRGVALFETTDALLQRGDRLVAENYLPLVIMDLSDDKVSLSLLKYPLWLAFAPDTRQSPPVSNWT